MAYPPPPGISNRNNSNSPHPSLPARPPPSTNPSSSSGGAGAGSGGGSSTGGFSSSFKPAYSSGPSYGASAPGQYGQSSYSSYGSYSQPPSSMSSASYQSAPQSYQQYSQPPGYQQGGYNASSTYSAAPQIRNPFPAPGAHGAHGTNGTQSASGPYQSSATNDAYDPEMAAQIAQWQSAYSSRDANAATPTTDGGRGGGRNNGIAGPHVTGDPNSKNPSNAFGPAAAAPISAADAAVAANQPPPKADKKKTVVREGGGKKWTDDTLLEWDPSHLRLFVGNLAGEVTDESLLKAFSRWTSVQKARVVRDKRTSKSKGYGFVSFSDADDFFQAAKEMNGKYIQSHPVVVRKANTEIKVSNTKEGRGGHGKNNRNNNKDRAGNGSGAGRQDGSGGGNGSGVAGGYDSGLGPVHHGGVSKPGQKTKNGLKLLG